VLVQFVCRHCVAYCRTYSLQTVYNMTQYTLSACRHCVTFHSTIIEFFFSTHINLSVPMSDLHLGSVIKKCALFKIRGRAIVIALNMLLQYLILFECCVFSSWAALFLVNFCCYLCEINGPKKINRSNKCQKIVINGSSNWT
jgi:hypothetical protein